MSRRHIPAALKLGLLRCYVRAGGGPTSPLHKTIYPSLGTRFFPPRSLARSPFRVALTARDSHDSAHPFTGKRERERERERERKSSVLERKNTRICFLRHFCNGSFGLRQFENLKTVPCLARSLPTSCCALSVAHSLLV
jgi:hypothetical protein